MSAHPPEPGFERWGPAAPASPVIVSVPHAGRLYPPAMLALLSVPVHALAALEDRRVDAVAAAALGGRTALVQRLGRAWIDLNRSLDERDPAVDAGARPAGAAARSARLRSGLGLVPARAGGAGALWRRRLTGAEVAERVEGAWRPYHDALAALLAAARARHGAAVLLDLHSMPPLGPPGSGPARVVVGDRFGRSAAARFAARAEAAAAAGLAAGPGGRVAVNAPYAGGEVLARHGDPANGVHAVQLELDRSLYLDASLDRPGPGLAATARLVARVAAALEDEALAGRVPAGDLPLAAE